MDKILIARLDLICDVHNDRKVNNTFRNWMIENSDGYFVTRQSANLDYANVYVSNDFKHDIEFKLRFG